jgi:nitroreductase
MSPEAAATEGAVALEQLLERRSVPALLLHPPGPSSEQIALAIDVALRAPDHGTLRPARFVLIEGAAREQLARLFRARLLAREPDVPAGKLEKAYRQPLGAPLVIAVAAHLVPGHKVPETEQLLSTAASVMNLLNAFHLQGYAAIWLTGGNAYDPEVAQTLGFAPIEQCLGFVYVGSADGVSLPPPRRPQRSEQVREWSGEQLA